MNEKYDALEKQFKEVLITDGKVLLGVIDNQQRISKLEKYLRKYKLRYRILDFFLLLNAIDIILKSIFGVGVYGGIIYIYLYIVSLL